MAKGFYIRKMTAGRHTRIARYTRAMPSDSKPVRRAKQAATTAAQKFINIKNTTERLELLLCANFDRKDESCFCTLTFSEGHIPANQKHTRAMVKAYLSLLRQEWKRTGRELTYIYTIEGDSVPDAQPVEGQKWEITPWRDSDRWAQMDDVEAQKGPETPIRLHAHCFLNLKKEDYEAVRALWPYGQVYISKIKVNDLTSFQRLASYVTKDSRNGKTKNGARAYTPSLNLQQPTVEGHWCSEYETITLPQGAEKIKSGSEYNEVYGSSMEYLVYRMPRPQPQPQPYKGKGKIGPKKRGTQRK